MTDSTKLNNFPFFVGVAGGSGSGKTTLARKVQERLGLDACEIVYQDCFYLDQSSRFDRDGGAVNFDHPGAIEFSLLANTILDLKNGRGSEIPDYDFSTHKRKPQRLSVPPREVYLVDGILLFHSEEIRNCLDLKVFVDTPEDLRFSRRLARDVKERGRVPDGVRDQFYAQVKPMHDLFVEPSKKFADLVVRDSELERATETICVEISMKKVRR